MSNTMQQKLESALADWFSHKHMSEVTTRRLDAAKIVKLLPSDEEDDYAINLTVLVHDLATALASGPAAPVEYTEPKCAGGITPPLSGPCPKCGATDDNDCAALPAEQRENP